MVPRRPRVCGTLRARDNKRIIADVLRDCGMESMCALVIAFEIEGYMNFRHEGLTCGKNREVWVCGLSDGGILGTNILQQTKNRRCLLKYSCSSE